MRNNSKRNSVLKVTALTAALLGAYGAVSSSVYAEPLLAEGESITVADQAYSDATASAGGSINGTNLEIVGARSTGTVRAESGGSIVLTGGAITSDSTDITGAASAVRADGHTSAIELNNLDVTQIGVHSHASPRAGVETRNGGTVMINGGTIRSTNDALLATGDGDLTGGGSITARNVNIEVSGNNAEGIHVYGYNGSTAEGVRHTGEVPENQTVINLIDSSLTTTGDDIWSVYANFSEAVVNVIDSDVTTSGVRSQAVTAGKFGQVNVTDSTVKSTATNTFTAQTYEWDAVVNLQGTRIESLESTSNAGGLLAAGTDSIINATDSHVFVQGTGGKGASVIDGNSINLTGGSVAVETAPANAGGSAVAQGLVADGAGSVISADNADISIKGSSTGAGGLSSAVVARNNGRVELNGGTVAATGEQFERGILVGTGGTVAATGVAISTLGDNSHAVHAHHTNGDTPEVTLSDTSITTSGKESYGIYSQNGGIVEGENVSVNTSNEAGFGIFGYNQGNVSLSGGAINTSGDVFTNAGGEEIGAFGVLAKRDSHISLNGTSISTTGRLAEGLRVEQEGTTPSSSIAAADVSITTQGSQAHAIGVYGGNGTVNMTGGSITTTGDNAAGAYIQDSGTVSLTGVDLNASGAALRSEITQAGQTQYFTLGADTVASSAKDILLEIQRHADDGADGVVNLTLGAGSFAVGNVLNEDHNSNLTSSEHTHINLEEGARWFGTMIDSDAIVVEEGETPVFEDDETVDGSLVGTQNSHLRFQGAANIQGDASTGVNSSMTFLGPTNISGNVAGQQGSSLSFQGTSTRIGGSLLTAGTRTHAGSGSFNVGGDVVGIAGSQFVFNGPTTIAGDLELQQGSGIQGGTRDNPVMVGGNAVVNDSMLGGNMNIAGRLSGENALLSPGNSVGTVTAGSIGELSGQYVAEVNGAGQSDLVVIKTGDVDLSGVALQVAQENSNGGYLLDHAYTIVQAEEGNIVAEFASESLDGYSFANVRVKLDPVAYGQKDVKVSLSADMDQIDRGNWSSNQTATYEGLMSAGSGNALAFAVLASPDMEDALNQLSGESHASTQAALLNSGDLLVRTLSARMRGNQGAGLVAGAPTAQASGAAPAGAMPTSAAHPFWAQVVGNWSTLDADGGRLKLKPPWVACLSVATPRLATVGESVGLWAIPKEKSRSMIVPPNPMLTAIRWHFTVETSGSKAEAQSTSWLASATRVTISIRVAM